MYNGQTKVQQTELDAFLAAAEELKIKGLTTSNPTGNTNDPTPTSRKRPSTHVQHEDSPFDNNGAGLQKSSNFLSLTLVLHKVYFSFNLLVLGCQKGFL